MPWLTEPGPDELGELTDVDLDTAAPTDGQVLTYDDGTSTWVPEDAGTPTLPLTTKGDILGYDTAAERVPVGTDGQVLTADSAEALGLKWVTPSAGGGGGVTNYALGKTYTLSPAADHTNDTTSVLADGESNFSSGRVLTNGIYPDGGFGSFGRGGCISWNNKAGAIRIDLGSAQEISGLRVHGTGSSGGGILSPDSVVLASSTDDSSFTTRLSLTSLTGSATTTWAVIRSFTAVSARYWRLTLTPESGSWVAVGAVDLLG